MNQIQFNRPLTRQESQRIAKNFNVAVTLNPYDKSVMTFNGFVDHFTIKIFFDQYGLVVTGLNGQEIIKEKNEQAKVKEQPSVETFTVTVGEDSIFQTNVERTRREELSQSKRKGVSRKIKS